MGGVQKPSHHDERVDAGLGDGGGYFPDGASASAYSAKAVTSDYGSERLRSIRYLLDRAHLIERPTVVDFGGGDGSFGRALGLDAGRVHLSDISPHMLDVARTQVGEDTELHLGSVEALAEIADESVDIVLCIDVFGYLDQSEQDLFFREAHRILRPDSLLIVNDGNELLDFFALNSGTADFFERQFDLDVSSLLTEASKRRWLNSSRSNPLNFGLRLASFGFDEVEQSFSHWHALPPGLAALDSDGDVKKARMAARDFSVDANALPDEDRWQALFRCSSFASLAVKVA